MEGIFQQSLYKWLGDGKIVAKGNGCDGVRQASSVSIVIMLRDESARSHGLVPGRIRDLFLFRKGDSNATTYSVVSWSFFFFPGGK